MLLWRAPVAGARLAKTATGGTQCQEEKGKEGVAEEGERGDVSSAVLAGTHEPVELRKPQMAAGIDAAVVNAGARPLKRNREHISAGGSPEHRQSSAGCQVSRASCIGGLACISTLQALPFPVAQPGEGRASVKCCGHCT